MWRFTLVVIFIVGATACGSAEPTTTTTTVPTVAVPMGWKTFAYGQAKISVPPDWTVVTRHGCANRSAPGVLALGAPNSLANCPVGANSIVVSSVSQGDEQAIALCPTIRVNGLTAHVLPCASSNPAGIVQYLIPALGIEAVGTGTSGEDVTGTGTDTVVGQVLHTLR